MQFQIASGVLRLIKEGKVQDILNKGLDLLWLEEHEAAALIVYAAVKHYENVPDAFRHLRRCGSCRDVDKAILGRAEDIVRRLVTY